MPTSSFDEKPNYDHLEPIPLAYGCAVIAISVLMFYSVNRIIFRFVRSPVEREETWKWRNLVVSWIHALIIGTWDLSCFYFYPEMMTDLIAYHNLYIYSMVAFSAGYFLYDMIDIAVNRQVEAMWEVVPHHLAVAGVFLSNIVASRYLAYTAVALLTEVNTIFLHARKLLRLHRTPFTAPRYRLNAAINLATLATCRFGALVWICVGMWAFAHRMSSVYLSGMVVVMTVMWVTNGLLCRRIVVNDVLRPWRAGKGKSAGWSNNNGNSSAAAGDKRAVD